MTSNIGWDLYRTFLAVLQEGSLSGAARALGMTQPTVGRHVTTLEAALHAPLFIRSQAGLEPTEVALALRAQAEAMQSTAAAMERLASGASRDEVSGVVRISASEVVGVEVLPPMLAKLRNAFPLLRIELVPTNRVQDLLQREADIAVRMSAPEQGRLVARYVGAVEIGLYARDDYLARYGTPERAADLAGHALIGFDEETPFLRQARQDLPFVWSREVFSFRSDSDLAQLALIRSGAGIGACQTGIARRDECLVRIWPQWASFQLGTWVVMHEGLRTSLGCRETFKALVAGLQAYAGAGSATSPVSAPAPTERGGGGPMAPMGGPIE